VSAEFDIDAVPAAPLTHDVAFEPPVLFDPAVADRPISTPWDDYVAPDEAEHAAHLEMLRRAYQRHEQRLARMRLYSYCMTLSACVFALMTFMYVTQGEADRDGTFISLGTAFGAMTIFLLWGAVRVTRVGEAPYRS
jgi:hypothetical protein